MGASLLALAKSIYYIHSVTHTTSGSPVVIEISFFSIRLFHFVDTYLLIFFYVNRKVMKSVLEMIFEQWPVTLTGQTNLNSVIVSCQTNCSSDRSKYTKTSRVRTCVNRQITTKNFPINALKLLVLRDGEILNLGRTYLNYYKPLLSAVIKLLK